MFVKYNTADPQSYRISGWDRMTRKSRKYFMIKSPQKNVADPARSNPQPPDHGLELHPTEPLRSALIKGT